MDTSQQRESLVSGLLQTRTSVIHRSCHLNSHRGGIITIKKIKATYSKKHNGQNNLGLTPPKRALPSGLPRQVYRDARNFSRVDPAHRSEGIPYYVLQASWKSCLG